MRFLIYLCFCFLFQGYPKLSQNYYALVECLAQDHMQFMAQIEPTVLVYILSTISEGLSAIGELYEGWGWEQGCTW